MAENSHQMNLRNYAESQGLRGSLPPYNTQQNGAVERKNRMIMEETREMLHD